MKKPLIGVAAALVIAILGLPAVLGMMTESRFRNSIESMDANNPVIALTIESYDRGWFSSMTRIDVGVDQDYARMMTGIDGAASVGGNLVAAMLADMTATFVVDIDHGPVVLRDGVFIGLSRFVARLSDDSAVVTELAAQLSMPYLVEIRGQLGLGGTFRYDADVPPIDYADDNGEVLFSGLTVEGTLRGTRLQSRGAIDELSFNIVGVAGQIRGISFTGDNQRVGKYFWTGPMEMVVDSIVVTNPLVGQEPMFDLSRLRLAGDSSLDGTGELIGGSFTYAADRVTAGQEFALADAELVITVENVAVDAIEAYYDAILSLDPNDPEAALRAMQAVADRLLEHDPSIAFAPLRFELMGEPFVANLRVQTVGGGTAGGFDLTNPLALATVFEVRADATASKALASRIATLIVEGQLQSEFAGPDAPPGQDIAEMARQQGDAMLGVFAGQGLIADAGDSYTTNIEYANGEVAVNGTPLPLGMLFQ